MPLEETWFDWVGPSADEEWIVVWERPCKHSALGLPASLSGSILVARLAEGPAT